MRPHQKPAFDKVAQKAQNSHYRSSVMPDGVNYLLNPAHADYHHIQLVEEKALVIDPRLWQQ